MKVFKDDGSIFQEILLGCKDIEDFYKMALRNVAISIGVDYEDPSAESEEVVHELLLQGMMYLDDTGRELIFWRYGLRLELNMIARIMGISKEEVEKQSLAYLEKFERILKGGL